MPAELWDKPGHSRSMLEGQEAHRGLLQLGEGFLCTQAEAMAWPHSAGTACALLSTGLGDGRHQQRLQPCARVVRPLLDVAGIDHECYSLQREGRLRHICGRNHLSSRPLLGYVP